MTRNFKNLAAAIALATAGSLALTPLVAQAQTEPEQPRTSYMVILLKLAPDAGERWSELSDKYFAPAAKAAGLPETTVHWMVDGSWDLMLLRPMPRGMAAIDTHASPERDAYMAELAKIAGGKEAAEKLMAESDKLVTESVRYFSHTHP